MRTFQDLIASVGAFTLVVVAPNVLAHHGSASTAGGASVRSAETLDAHGLSIDINWVYTAYQDVESSGSDAEADDHDHDTDHAAPMHGDETDHLDALDWALLQTFELVHGVAPDLDISLSTGVYRGANLREIGDQADALGDVSGMTDTRIGTKWRELRDDWQGAAFVEVLIPTGRTDAVGNHEGTPVVLDGDVQPGIGTFGALAGGALITRVNDRLKINASAEYERHFERAGFKLGDRTIGGVGVSYRIGSVHAFAETVVRRLGRDQDEGREVGATGGTTAFATLGARIASSEHFSLSPAAQFPIFESLNGEQQKTGLRVLFNIAVNPLH